MQLEIVDVNPRLAKARPDDHLYGVAFCPRIEFDQRMFVQPQLLLHASEAIGSHRSILACPRQPQFGANVVENSNHTFVADQAIGKRPSEHMQKKILICKALGLKTLPLKSS